MTTKKRPKTPKEAAEQDVEELTTLHPEKTVQLGDRSVIIRPFGFVESLKLEVHAQPITAELKRELLDHKEFDLTRVMAALGRQHVHFLALVGAATGLTEEDLEELNDEEGMKLVVAFWEVHRDFFTRRLVLAASAEAAARQVNQARATGRSSRSSSAPDTGSRTSGDTPAPSSSSSSDTPRG